MGLDGLITLDIKDILNECSLTMGYLHDVIVKPKGLLDVTYKKLSFLSLT